MDKKGIEEVFNHFSRYDGMKEELYGFVEFSPDWIDGDYYSFRHKLISSIEGTYKTLVSEIPEYTSESLVSIENPFYRDFDALTSIHLNFDMPGYRRSCFTDSTEELHQSIGDFKYKLNEIYLVLINFNGGKPAKTHHIEVVSLSRAFKNMMSTGSIEKVEKDLPLVRTFVQKGQYK